MKKSFNEPVLEIIEFCDDVIVTSGGESVSFSDPNSSWQKGFNWNF